MMRIHRLYIGSDNKTKALDMDQIKSLASSMFQGFNISTILGSWQGHVEDTALLEIATETGEKVLELAKLLKERLGQDAIGYVEMPVDMKFI
jgi:hypothetical protein